MSRIYRRQSILSIGVDEAFAYFASAKGFAEHFPYPVRFLENPEPWTLGSVLVFQYRVLGIWFKHTAKIREWDPPRLFADCQIGGFPREFCHYHHFRPVEQGTCVEDEVRYRSGLGGPFDALFVGPVIAHVFRRRHRNLARIFPVPAGRSQSC